MSLFGSRAAALWYFNIVLLCTVERFAEPILDSNSAGDVPYLDRKFYLVVESLCVFHSPP